MGGPWDGRSWYQLLGVEDFAPEAKVREAYIHLARVLHPDHHMEASDPERHIAERRMREVNAAWAVLGDEESRRVYDIGLRSKLRYKGSTT